MAATKVLLEGDWSRQFSVRFAGEEGKLAILSPLYLEMPTQHGAVLCLPHYLPSSSPCLLHAITHLHHTAPAPFHGTLPFPSFPTSLPQIYCASPTAPPVMPLPSSLSPPPPPHLTPLPFCTHVLHTLSKCALCQLMNVYKCAGLDAGGVCREFFDLLTGECFDPAQCLFRKSDDSPQALVSHRPQPPPPCRSSCHHAHYLSPPFTLLL